MSSYVLIVLEVVQYSNSKVMYKNFSCTMKCLWHTKLQLRLLKHGSHVLPHKTNTVQCVYIDEQLDNYLFILTLFWPSWLLLLDRFLAFISFQLVFWSLFHMYESLDMSGVWLIFSSQLHIITIFLYAFLDSCLPFMLLHT